MLSGLPSYLEARLSIRVAEVAECGSNWFEQPTFLQAGKTRRQQTCLHCRTSNAVQLKAVSSTPQHTFLNVCIVVGIPQFTPILPISPQRTFLMAVSLSQPDLSLHYLGSMVTKQEDFGHVVHVSSCELPNQRLSTPGEFASRACLLAKLRTETRAICLGEARCQGFSPTWDQTVKKRYPSYPDGRQQPEYDYGADHVAPRRVADYEGNLSVGTLNRLCEEGQLSEAVGALDFMVQRGSYVENSLFYSVLRRCFAHKDLFLGRRVHCLAVKSGYESNAFLANHFIRMYASYGRLEETRQVFNKVTVPNCHMWASIILAHAQHGQPRNAIEFYQQMQETTVKPNNYVFVAVLTACAAANDLQCGKQVHADILGAEDKPNIFVGNCLVDMYAKCDSLDDAHRVFNSMPKKNVVTWNAMIAGYAQHGLGQEALALFTVMQHEGTTAGNCVTFACLLQACAGTRSLLQGKEIHSQIRERGLEGDVVIVNCLVNMYAKCGSLEEATRVFTKVDTPNRYMWASIISAHSQHEQPRNAIKLYQQMRESVLEPSNCIFVAVLKACAAANDVFFGREVHADIVRIADKPNIYVGNCLVDMYVKCGSLHDARIVFDNLPSKDVVTWNTMISGYVQRGLGQEALALYACMRHDGMTVANCITFACVLQACTCSKSLLEGMKVHSEIQKQGLEADVVVGNCLVNMYAKCGSLENARGVFDKLPNRDVVTWTAMISGYAQRGFGQAALTLYASMQEEGISLANHVTFVCLLQACASVGALLQGKEIHSEIQKRGLESDVVICNCLVNMYAKCGSLEDACLVFNTLPTKDVVTWTAMIAGYAQHGLSQEALALYRTMQQDGMIPADAITFVCLLQACGGVAGLEKGKEIHAQISKSGLEVTDLYVASTLIDMYSKCGSMVNAQEVFDALPLKDIVTWNTLIAGYARQGESELVRDLFYRLRQEGIQPNNITFVSILTVCSHVGLVDQGNKYFEVMRTEYGISPTIEHYNCMVDLLARAGHLDKAMEMVKTMPFQPLSYAWRSILGACQKWSNVELGRRAFECAIKLDKNDVVAYVLMSNIYSAAHRWEDVNKIQAMRVRAQAWKKQGQSWWTDVGGIVHSFAAEEETPERKHICAKLRDISVRLQEEEY